MRAYVDPDDNRLPHCCGIMDIGNFKLNKEGFEWGEIETFFPKIKDIEKPRGCNIFTTTLLPSQTQALSEL